MQSRLTYFLAACALSITSLSSLPCSAGMFPARAQTGQVATGEIGSGAVPLALSAPVQSWARDKSFPLYAARWWRWLLPIPKESNPLLDLDGSDCARRQSGPVWYLAGVQGSGSVDRSCTIPRGKALFFPLVNVLWTTGPEEEGYGLFPGDPGFLAFRAQVRAILTCIKTGADLALWIDGHSVPNLERHYTQSAVFQVKLPTDPIEFGYPGNTKLIPNFDAGYYVLLPPLPPGKHKLRWRASSTGCGPISQDITYHLTVRHN